MHQPIDSRKRNAYLLLYIRNRLRIREINHHMEIAGTGLIVVVYLQNIACERVTVQHHRKGDQTCTVPSSLADAMCFPSGDHATALTLALCLLYVWIGF